MEKLDKSQRKKIINEALKDFFKKEQMLKYNIWDNGYNIKKDINKEYIYIGLLSFMTSFQEINYTNFIHIKKVEDIILEIQFPDFDFSGFIEKRSYLRTIRLSYFNNQNTESKLHRLKLDWTEEDCLRFAKNIVEYYENEVSPLFGYYSYLPNILKEMDKLESEGKYWSEILEGGGAYLFKGLIISKLCNDPNYNVKEEFVYRMFHDQIDDWTPYCDKLITYLKHVDPIYNI
ncbi:MAG: hypothetical protein LBT43_18400 [Prevotella sp.]|jgi:hypothetical protein|nr:hypothetical protein [Prevotella sp.]